MEAAGIGASHVKIMISRNREEGLNKPVTLNK
jgi:hypothetical protein